VPKRPSIVGQLSLFPEESPSLLLERPWPKGLFVGTSSWSFPGWSGLIYPGKESESKLSREGLRLYSARPGLSAVGIDRTYYSPMTAKDYSRYAEQVPEGFRFLVKAPEVLMVPRFSKHARYGTRAGRDNPDFLSPRLATDEWISPAVEGLGKKLGCLLLQFSPMSLAPLGVPSAFAQRLHNLLQELPNSLPLAVEIRNRDLFCRAYVQVLERLEVSHCLVVHPTMPSLREQWARVPPSQRCIIRWMLHPGRANYQEAVEHYEPFNSIVDPDFSAREEICRIWKEALEKGREVMTIVNNKAEGCSPLSIEALANQWWEDPGFDIL